MYGGNTIGYIFLSTDGGVTWTTIVNEYSNNGRRVNLAVSEANSDVVYAIMSQNGGSLYGIYKSTDSGASYSKVYDGTVSGHNLLGWKTDGSDAGGQGGYDLAISVSPVDADTIYIGGVNTHKSTDGGTTWSAVNCWTSSGAYNKNLAFVVHADKHMLKFRSSDNVLFETNDGGVYYTADAGVNWTDVTNGIVISQMYRLGVATTSTDEVITGLQDNGTKLLSEGNWNAVIGGDGMECLVDYSDKNIQYGTISFGQLRRTTDHWASAINVSVGSGSGAWVSPYVLDPDNHQTIYMGLDTLWKSTNMGSSWTKIANMTTQNRIRSIAIAPSNNQVIYVADLRNIWLTIDGGISWIDITGTLPVSSSYITYISVKDNDPSTVWVSMGQFNSYGVFKTTDGGVSWDNISTGLPQIPVMCVIQNRQNTSDEELYAGTDLGVYVKIGDNAWQPFNDGLPNVIVDELEIYYDNTNPSQSKLWAATSGRGLWSSKLYSPPNTPPNPEFSADYRVPSTSDTVTLTDLSTNSPQEWEWSFSPNTITFVNGTSLFSRNPQVVFDNQGFYEIKLKVTNTYGSDSLIKKDYIHVYDYCYAEGSGDIYIDNVEFGSINNQNTGYKNYNDFSYLSTSLKTGSSGTISINFGRAYYNDTVAGWVDWNHDGDFTDANEEVFLRDVQNITETCTITVPDDALPGFTRLRIRNKHDTNDISPCGVTNLGEVEDYAIEVLPEENIWLGNSNQWDATSNWSKGKIPTMSYNVTIPSSPSGGNFPVVPAGVTAKCNKLILEENATITVNGEIQINQ